MTTSDAAAPAGLFAEEEANQEIECKLPIPGRETIANRLRALDAENEGDELERNWVFDNAADDFQKTGTLLRLREYGGCFLTYKGPIREGSHYRRREELETEVSDPDIFRLILERLGYRQIWYYEKYRNTWRHRDCEVALDLLPDLGAYIEVEGESEDAIDAVLTELGLAREAHVRESYRCLFHRHCEERGEPVRDMRF
jgi:adenylate cyclase class 2